MSDAIPARGCVLYANPTLAILDNRFTADTSGCPDVIDWLGQERVLDNGVSVTGSGSANKKLQTVMSHWLDASDAIVLEAGNFGLNAANVGYLSHHFERRAGIPRGLRIYVRASRHRQGRDAEGPLAIDSRSSHDRGG